MHVDEAIRERRTMKDFGPTALDRDEVAALLDLAVYAPNHHRTEPWRFVVIGPETIDALATAGDDRKLRRSQTAIVVVQVVADDPDVDREDYAACACAIQNLMLAARGRDLVAFWRTPGSIGTPAARALLGVGPDDRMVGIVHVGQPAGAFPASPQRDAAGFTRWLP